MRYRFKIPFRQFRVGDLVPETYDRGTVLTMLQSHRVEESPEEKAIAEPPADKMMRPARVKRKGAGAISPLS